MILSAFIGFSFILPQHSAEPEEVFNIDQYLSQERLCHSQWSEAPALAHVNNAHSLRTSSPPHSCPRCFSLVYSSTSHSLNVSCLHIYYLCQHYSKYWKDNTLVDYKTQLMGHS